MTLAFAVYALLLDHDALLRSARFARRSALVGRARHAARADARARRRRPRRGPARPRCGGRRHPGPRAARVPARLRVARACDEPRRGDGGARLRAARGDARAVAARGARSTGSRCVAAAALVAGVCCGSSDGPTSCRFSYAGATRPALADVSLAVEPGEIVLLTRPAPAAARRRSSGRSPGSSRTSMAAASRAASRSAGSTRGGTGRPISPGTVATLFQDPEDQVVFGGVRRRGRVRAREHRRAARRRSTAACACARPRSARSTCCRAAGGRAVGRRAPARLPRLDARARAGSSFCSTSRRPSSTPSGAPRFLELVAAPGARTRDRRRAQRAARGAGARLLRSRGLPRRRRDRFSTSRATRRALARARTSLRASASRAADAASRRGAALCRLDGVDFAYATGPPVRGSDRSSSDEARSSPDRSQRQRQVDARQARRRSARAPARHASCERARRVSLSGPGPLPRPRALRRGGRARRS